MQVFIPSKNREKTITSHKVFPTAKILVHTRRQKAQYKMQGIKGQRIIVTGTKQDVYGLTRQREFAVQNLIEDGEWFVFADDNIRSLTWLPEPHYNSLSAADIKAMEPKEIRSLFKTKCSWKEFRDVVVPDTIKFAEGCNARLCGFALVDNYFFRTKKFRSIGYVIGKLMLLKNSGLTFSHTITMEDFRNTAHHLLKFGAVTINNFVFPIAGHYEKGGMGTYEERIPYRKADVERLLFMYEGLFKVKNRKGFEPNTDLQLVINSRKRLEKWRGEMCKKWGWKRKASGKKPNKR